MANEVTESTIRTNGFKSIYTIINDNKVSGTTVYGGFPNKNPSFPCYILHPIIASSTNLTYGNTIDYDLEIEIELWCTADQLKNKIDEMKDNISTTILSNISTLKTQNLLLADDWFDDTNVESPVINEEKFHTGNVMLRFKII